MIYIVVDKLFLDIKRQSLVGNQSKYTGDFLESSTKHSSDTVFVMSLMIMIVW